MQFRSLQNKKRYHEVDPKMERCSIPLQTINSINSQDHRVREKGCFCVRSLPNEALYHCIDSPVLSELSSADATPLTYLCIDNAGCIPTFPGRLVDQIEYRYCKIILQV